MDAMPPLPTLPTLPTAAEIEELAKGAGLSIPKLCAAADVHTSTFYRWREGKFSVQTGVVQRFIDAIGAARSA
jgi:hypothetical protein